MEAQKIYRILNQIKAQEYLKKRKRQIVDAIHKCNNPEKIELIAEILDR